MSAGSEERFLGKRKAPGMERSWREYTGGPTAVHACWHTSHVASLAVAFARPKRMAAAPPTPGAGGGEFALAFLANCPRIIRTGRMATFLNWLPLRDSHLINLTIQLTHRVASTASGERRTSPEEGPYAVLPQESRSECGGAGPRRLQFGVRERDASLSLLSENADNL